MAARRPILCALAIVAACMLLLQPSATEQDAFIVNTPALRAGRQNAAFAGNEVADREPAVVMYNLFENEGLKDNLKVATIEDNNSAIFLLFALFGLPFVCAFLIK